MKRYTHLTITCPDAESAEILTAFLSDYPFECFSDNATEEGVVVETYMAPEDWAACGEEATNIINDYGTLTAIKEIEDENWNATWEAESFQPVDVDGKIYEYTTYSITYSKEICGIPTDDTVRVQVTSKGTLKSVVLGEIGAFDHIKRNDICRCFINSLFKL